MSEPGIEALFLPLGRGRCFCLLHRPVVRNGHVILQIAPFAEEMNRSRRVMALAARALARGGWTVLQMDLYGCGDSEGDLEDADWDTWIHDVVRAAQWLRSEHGDALVLWGVRAGCLLTCEAAPRLEDTPVLLMWQPVVSGARHLQQFRRVEAAAGALRAASGFGGAVDETNIAQATFDVAGYRVSPLLATGLASAALLPPVRPSRLALVQIGNAGEFDQDACDTWRNAGWRIEASTLAGPTFWRVQGIVDVPGLVEATESVVTAACA